MNIRFHFSGINAQKCNYVRSICFVVYFLKTFPKYFPEWLYHLTFLPTMYKGSSFPAASLAFGIVTTFILALLIGG